MATFSADWLNGGEPIEVKPLPFRGVKETTQVRRKHARRIATYGTVMSLYVFGTVLGVKRLMEQSGVEPARKAWKDNLNELGIANAVVDQLDFPDDEFEEGINDMIEGRVRQQLAPLEDESLEDALARNLEEALGGQDIGTVVDDLKELEMEEAALEMYWRHRLDKPVITAGSEELEWNVENLSLVMTFEDWVRYRQALDEAEFEDKDDEDAAGVANKLLSPRTGDEIEKN